MASVVVAAIIMPVSKSMITRGSYVFLASAIVLLFLIALAPHSVAQVSNSSSGTPSLYDSGMNDSDRPIYVEGYVTRGQGDGTTNIPVPGATVYFIKNQSIVNQSKTNAIGYYNVIITPGTYSVVTAAQGFQTLMTEETFRGTRTLDRILYTIPYNGLVTYSVNPVVETSPGRPVSCTIAIENSQLVDQYLEFGLQAPDDNNWTGWCPEGEMLGVRANDKGQISFMLQYNGNRTGAYVWYILASGGSYFAKIPVVVVVKDLPYETIDLYSNYPQRAVKAGEIVDFPINVNSKYAVDKPLNLSIDKPPGWGATTGNGTLFYAAGGQQATSDFWVYAPSDAAPGFYTINLTLNGNGVSSNTLRLLIQVEGTPAFDALIKGYRTSSEGYPSINLSGGDTFDLPVRVYNNGNFPLEIMATAEVGDNWAYYLEGAPWNKIDVAPGDAAEFNVRSRVPNDTVGNFTAKIYLEANGKELNGNGQDYMLMAQLNVLPRGQPPINGNSLVGLGMAAGTVGVIAASLVAATKRHRRY